MSESIFVESVDEVDFSNKWRSFLGPLFRKVAEIDRLCSVHDPIHPYKRKHAYYELSERFPNEDNVLIKMHNAGLITSTRARSIEELASLLALDARYIRQAIEKALAQGYLESTADGRTKYFLSKKGIMFVSSLFTRRLFADRSVPAC
ncbi:MAG: hypothetical protein ACP5UU_00300 [Thermoprotei archaeon]